jgi:hypothetical protein
MKFVASIVAFLAVALAAPTTPLFPRQTTTSTLPKLTEIAYRVSNDQGPSGNQVRRHNTPYERKNYQLRGRPMTSSAPVLAALIPGVTL